MKTETDRQIDELEYQLQDIKQRVAELRRQRPREEIKDYRLLDSEGRGVSLSSLFGDQNRLILIHNMGRDCSYCTMWADGFTGLVPHINSRAAFALTSPDKPEAQKDFVEARGWNFPVYSTAGTSFTADMGFDDEKEGLMPGISVFTKEANGKIYRVSRAEIGPGDNFCAVWHFFDLLPEGINGWQPQLSYDLAGLVQIGNLGEA
ncbi:MAG TPA: DUF899 family protein [Terriglobales bacterium]|jgi:predicted dithiol-disulfide oxidoreductase (DUF899 family)